MRTEPVAIGAAIVAAVQAVLGTLAAFNLPVTEAQQTAIIGLTGALIVLTGAVAALIRSRSTPSAKVVEQLDPDGSVVAGEASELPTGEYVRTIGSGDEPGYQMGE